MTAFSGLFNRFRDYTRLNFSLSLAAGIILVPLLLWLFLTQPFYLAPAVLLGLVAFLLVAREPRFGLYLMVLSVPVQDKFALSLGGGGKLTVTQGMVLLTLAGFLINRLAFQKPFVNSPTPPLLKWFLIYIGAMVVSLLTAFSLDEGLNGISRWLITFFAYLLATSVIQTRRQFWELVIVLLAGGIFEAGLGIVQTGLGLGPESFAITEDLSRAFGTFTFPNPYAGYLEMSLPLMLALAFMAWKQRNQAMKAWLEKSGQPRQKERRDIFKAYGLMWLTWPAVPLLALAVFASYSRGSWLGLAMGALVMLAVRGWKSTWLWLLLVIVAIFGILALQTGAVSPSIALRVSSIADQLTPFDVREVVTTPDNFAVVERMAHWQAGGNMFLYNMWFGVGIGNFEYTYNRFNMPMWIYSRGHAHNYYIHAAAETGLIGLTAYLFLVIAVFVTGWKAVRQIQDQNLRYVCWGSLGIISAIMFHNIVENLHVLNLGIQWCGVLALCYLAQKLDKAKM